jgi:protein-tyrosine phosphatase
MPGRNDATMEILFVCSGNILRSPFAEGCMRKVLEDIGHVNVTIASAGTLGLRGFQADAAARTLALERGFDIQGHRSRGITAQDLARADLVVVMEQAHKDRIAALDAAAAGRTRLIREYEKEGPTPQVPDLPDPIGKPREEIVAILELLERCVQNLAFRLKHGREV